MAIQPIIKFPKPSLTWPTVPIQFPLSDDLLDQLMRDIGTLEDTLAATDNGLAIAHNQVFEFVPQRLFVINPNVPSPALPRIVINPYWKPLIDGRNDMAKEMEGCLSFPGLSFPISRHLRIQVDFQTIDGARHTEVVSDLWARVVQHECEHLDGHNFLRNLPKKQQIDVRNDVIRRRKAGRW